MKKYLLPPTGKFYKSCLHIHSNLSDGKFSPEELKKLYMEQGFSVIAYTDHEFMLPHNDLSDDNFIALTSGEFSVTEDYTGKSYAYPKTYHINVYSPDKNRERTSIFSAKYVWREQSKNALTEEMLKDDYTHDYSLECLNDMIARANAEGLLVVYNHPVWSQQTRDDYIGLKGLWGIEVFNTGSYVEGYIESVLPADELLREGERVVLACTDDMHDLKHAFGGWVMLKADALTYDNIFNAMRDKNLYSSTGPEINDLYLEDDKLCIKTSVVREILLSSERRYARFVKGANGELINGAEFDVKGYIEDSIKCGSDPKKAYLRITAIDNNGKCAYTRAYYLDELLEK